MIEAAQPRAIRPRPMPRASMETLRVHGQTVRVPPTRGRSPARSLPARQDECLRKSDARAIECPAQPKHEVRTEASIGRLADLDHSRACTRARQQLRGANDRTPEIEQPRLVPHLAADRTAIVHAQVK